MIDDIVNIFNKSDFEIIEEVARKSKEHDYYFEGTETEGYYIGEGDGIFMVFDKEGNIL